MIPYNPLVVSIVVIFYMIIRSLRVYFKELKKIISRCQQKQRMLLKYLKIIY